MTAPGDGGGDGLTAPDAAPLLVQQRGRARWLFLNRPERRNALNPLLVDHLRRAVAEAMSDPCTAVVVIAGNGPSFCAGADLQHLHAVAARGGDPLAFLSAVSECFTEIERSPKPVAAAVHGHVVAGGLELALACDVVVAQSGTMIGDGHVRNGLLPAGGASVRLPRKVGEPLARWLMLTGKLLPAEAFTASGFVHAVAPADRFDHVMALMLNELCSAAGPAHGHLKQLLSDLHHGGQDEALGQELATFASNWRDTDIAAALARFASPASIATE